MKTRDPLAWAALTAALAVTASAEYELARACGFGPWVAAGVPAALDIYAVRALRVHRDVLAVVFAMIAVNAASHLVSAQLLPVSVSLVVAISAIAPLVLWRVHALRAQPTAPAPAQPAASDDFERAAEQAVEVTDPDAPSALVLDFHPHPQPHPDVCATASSAVQAADAPAPQPEPASDAAAPVVRQMPTPDADAQLLAAALEVNAAALAETGQRASLRRLQSELRIGQKRAQRIQAQLPDAVGATVREA
ncbi:hypothetical protein [Streptomyces sp. BK340]|uniref:hypothetical protein n=1 Tax=Streptomyces sp. BK340 TaxID=2572903 RepID=UPI0011AD466F|nr:hypothetical protein [Streptomyces sp. BK340]TVZ96494.1 hypothetical protein FB157_103405 [Streptomyces sp. BK340]